MKVFQVAKSTFLAVLTLASVAANAQTPFNQRDPAWSWETLGWGPGTIGGQGCVITCLASVQSWRGWSTNPSHMNAWGKANGGFSGDLVVWAAYHGFNQLRDYSNVPADLNFINNRLDSGYKVIVKTFFPPSRTSQHWVLLYGRSGNTYYMMDPWYGSMGNTFNAVYGDPARWIYRVAVYGP